MPSVMPTKVADERPEDGWHPARLLATAGIGGQEDQEQRATSSLLARDAGGAGLRTRGHRAARRTSRSHLDLHRGPLQGGRGEGHHPRRRHRRRAGQDPLGVPGGGHEPHWA